MSVISESPVILACGADEAFAMPMAVTLFSAISRLSRPAEVYVIDGGMVGGTRQRLEDVMSRARADTRVTFIRPLLDVLRKDALPLGRYGPMTYLRLLLPAVLPREVTHILYLDSDLLVRSDLAQLWDQRQMVETIAGAPDYASPLVSGRDGVPNWQDRGLPANAPYVNAGVLILNLTTWRENDLAGEILDYSFAHRAINRFADQDGINALLCQQCNLLDIKWNIPAYLEFDTVLGVVERNPVLADAIARRAELLRSGGVIHFIGSRKPWRYGLGARTQWEWLRWLSRSGWFADDVWRYRRLVLALRCDALLRAGVRAVRRWRGGLICISRSPGVNNGGADL
jgi:lipopolysaccharide biosynthesis glycosyltransferase